MTFRKTLSLVFCSGLLAVSSFADAHPLDTLQAGEWYRVPNSNLNAVDPCPSVYCPPGNSGLKSVMAAWSGAAFDAGRSRLYVWGGGHQDYSGNEIYVFDIESLRWSRLSDPSVVNSGGSTWFYSDGSPRSMHTWSYFEYVPILGKLVSFGGVAPYPVSGTTRQVFSYDIANGNWETDTIPDVPSGGNARGSNAIYDPATGDIWVLATNLADSRLHRYNVNTNSWTSAAATQYVQYHVRAAIDPDRRLLVAVGNGQFFVWDLNNPDEPPTSPSTAGDSAIENAASPGFAFDEEAAVFVAWDGGASVYILDPTTWTWTRKSPAAGNSVVPTNPPNAGTHGRFRYLPKWNAYMVVNNVDQDVYFYRLGGESPTRPNPPVLQN